MFSARAGGCLFATCEGLISLRRLYSAAKAGLQRQSRAMNGSDPSAQLEARGKYSDPQTNIGLPGGAGSSVEFDRPLSGCRPRSAVRRTTPVPGHQGQNRTVGGHPHFEFLRHIRSLLPLCPRPTRSTISPAPASPLHYQHDPVDANTSVLGAVTCSARKRLWLPDPPRRHQAKSTGDRTPPDRRLFGATSNPIGRRPAR